MDTTLQALIDYSQGASLPFTEEFRVDDNVLSKFPKNTKVLSARLVVFSEEWYFLKSAPENHGRRMMEGEFCAMSEIYKWAPDLVPKPHSWGKYATKDLDAYFFLSEYVDMNESLPAPNQLCAKLAHLHRESRSPNGQFVFHVTTCQGRVPQQVSWEKSWTRFFTRLLKNVIQLDSSVNDHWEELNQLEEQLISTVIPRLLDVLVEGGRTIKPSLIHADLWEGNSGTASKNGNVVIFDSAAFYAHNEMEVGDWRCYYNKISNPAYTNAYLCHHGPSDPEEEWDDRNRLYSRYLLQRYLFRQPSWTGKSCTSTEDYSPIQKLTHVEKAVNKCLRLAGFT
ncbi:Fructosamine kinase-domain-containing protein [Annulohypoxylon bovei var. microspora]|nr:Fructosamine kinase-domain-containing protein [Annulohypoxylon bovei var. microspora]